MNVELGWAAPKISEQFPSLDEKDAYHLQRDHEDLSRLKVRGLITRSEHKNALNRFCKKLYSTLKDAEK